MSDGVRSVRATPQFFHDLDDQFSAERGPNGEPSAHDYLVVELFRVIEVADQLAKRAVFTVVGSNESWLLCGSQWTDAYKSLGFAGLRFEPARVG